MLHRVAADQQFRIQVHQRGLVADGGIAHRAHRRPRIDLRIDHLGQRRPIAEGAEITALPPLEAGAEAVMAFIHQAAEFVLAEQLVDKPHQQERFLLHCEGIGQHHFSPRGAGDGMGGRDGGRIARPDDDTFEIGIGRCVVRGRPALILRQRDLAHVFGGVVGDGEVEVAAEVYPGHIQDLAGVQQREVVAGIGKDQPVDLRQRRQEMPDAAEELIEQQGPAGQWRIEEDVGHEIRMPAG